MVEARNSNHDRRQTLHGEKTEVSPLHGVTEVSPLHGVTEVSPLHEVTEVSPLHGVTELSPLHEVTEVSPLHGVVHLSIHAVIVPGQVKGHGRCFVLEGFGDA